MSVQPEDRASPSGLPIPTSAKVRRISSAAVVLGCAGAFVAFVMPFPEIAGEPKPAGYETPSWVLMCWAAGIAMLGVAVLLGVATTKLKQHRARLLNDVEVLSFLGGVGDPRNVWVKLVHRPTGLEVESKTEKSHSRNRERALDRMSVLLSACD